jgi:hypothetical protein
MFSEIVVKTREFKGVVTRYACLRDLESRWLPFATCKVGKQTLMT